MISFQAIDGQTGNFDQTSTNVAALSIIDSGLCFMGLSYDNNIYGYMYVPFTVSDLVIYLQLRNSFTKFWKIDCFGVSVPSMQLFKFMGYVL